MSVVVLCLVKNRGRCLQLNWQVIYRYSAEGRCMSTFYFGIVLVFFCATHAFKPYIHNFTTFLNSSGRKYVTLIACARFARVSSPHPRSPHRLRRNIMSICMLHVGKVRAINAKCTCRRNVHDGGGTMSTNLRPAWRTRGIFPMNIKRHITPTSY